MGRRRTNKRRRRKGGKLGIHTIANLKVKSHILVEKMRKHLLENKDAKKAIYEGDLSKAELKTLRALDRADLQLMDAMMDTMITHGPDATHDTATFVTLAGKKMISIGNDSAKNVGDLAAAHGPEAGRKAYDFLLPIMQQSKDGFTAGLEFIKEKGGDVKGWLHLHKPEAPDFTKAQNYVQNIAKNLPNPNEKIAGFVKINKQVFSFVVDNGKATVKGVGGFLGKIGNPASKLGEMGLSGAKAVGTAVGTVGKPVGKFLMGGIKFAGNVVWTVGKGFGGKIGKVLGFIGNGGLKILNSMDGELLMGILKVIGCICTLPVCVTMLLGRGGGKRRTKRRRGRKRGRRRTKKKRRRTKKKRRRY